jgi:hypothetical protein
MEVLGNSTFPLTDNFTKHSTKFLQYYVHQCIILAMMGLLYKLLNHREWLQIKGWLEECLNFSSEQICIPYTTNKFPRIQIRAVGDATEWMHRAPISGSPRLENKHETNLTCRLALKFNFLRRPISPGLLLFVFYLNTYLHECNYLWPACIYIYIYIYNFHVALSFTQRWVFWLELESSCVSLANACVSAGKCWYLKGTCQCNKVRIAYCQHISLLSQLFSGEMLHVTSTPEAYPYFANLFWTFCSGSKRSLYLLLGGDNINCNTFLIPPFTVVHCWCHLFSGIRKTSVSTQHAFLCQLQTRHSEAGLLAHPCERRLYFALDKQE